MSALEAVYRALLTLYPRAFREAVGERLVEDLRRAVGSRSTAGGRIVTALRELADLLGNVPGAWRDAGVESFTGEGRRISMAGLGQDLGYAVRSLGKRPGFALVVVATLALGIGANVAVFGVVDGVLLEPLPYPEAEELVYMFESYQGDQTRSVSYPNFLDWRARNGAFEDVGARTAWSFTMTGDAEAVVLRGLLTSANLLPLLGVEPVLGRTFTTDEERAEDRVLLLSHELWVGRFGADPGIIGRSLALDGAPWTVVGVLAPRLEFPLRADVYAPLTTLSTADRERRDSRPGISVIARLRPGTSLEAARRDMDALASQLADEYPDANAESGVVARSLRERYLGAAPPVLAPLGAAVVLVLLIACANVTNLFLVRARTRQREAAVRAALGAGRARIARVCLAEAGILAGAGALLGTLLAAGTMTTLQEVAGAGVPRIARAEIDATAFVFIASLSIAVTLLVGLLPALRLSATDPARQLAGGGDRGGTAPGGRLRGGLVVAEVALSFVLLAASGLMLRSTINLGSADPGFDPAGVLTVGVPVPESSYPTVADRARFFDAVVERVAAGAGVIAVGGGDPLPMGGNNRQYRTEAAEPSAVGPAGLRTDWYSVTPEYFAAMKIPFLEGAPFEGRESGGEPSVVVDQTFAERHWPGESALGRRVRVAAEWSPWFTVVGVVEHVSLYGPRTEGREQIYLPHHVRMWGQNLVIRSERSVDDLLAEVRAAVAEVDSQVPIGRVATLQSLVDGAVAAERLATSALVLFGAVALGLALLGLFGVVSYTVSLRTREIGVRVALGARPPSAVGRVAGHGLGLAALGIGLGVVGALAAMRLLESLLFGVEASDGPTLAGVGALLLAVSAIAALIPALRAGRVDPAQTLRAD